MTSSLNNVIRLVGDINYSNVNVVTSLWTYTFTSFVMFCAAGVDLTKSFAMIAVLSVYYGIL